MERPKETFFCNKCGYFGEDQFPHKRHDGSECGYFASSGLVWTYLKHIEAQLKATQDELERVKVEHQLDMEYYCLKSELATSKTEGFNEGIEAAALKAEENDCYIIGGDIRALKREET